MIWMHVLLIISSWYVCDILMCLEEGAMRKQVAREDGVLYVCWHALTLWEEETVCKPMAGEDGVLYVLTCMGVWEEWAMCKSMAGEDGILCVLICIGIWEEGTVRKWMAGVDEKNWITDSNFWYVCYFW